MLPQPFSASLHCTHPTQTQQSQSCVYGCKIVSFGIPFYSFSALTRTEKIAALSSSRREPVLAAVTISSFSPTDITRSCPLLCSSLSTSPGFIVITLAISFSLRSRKRVSSCRPVVCPRIRPHSFLLDMKHRHRRSRTL